MKGEMKRREDLKGAFFKETKITINKIMPSLKLFVSEFKGELHLELLSIFGIRNVEASDPVDVKTTHSLLILFLCFQNAGSQSSWLILRKKKN